MVQGGKAAKVIGCREAEVKVPMSGKFQMPIEGAMTGKMAGVRKVKRAEVTFPRSVQLREPNEVITCVENGERRAREVVPAHVEDGERRAREVVPAHVEDGERRAREVVPAHAEDGERRAREAVPAHVEDGERRAREAVPVHAEDGERRAREAVPAHVEDGEARARKMASYGRVLQVLPEMADESPSTVQRRQTQMAWDDLTLSQLFATKTGSCGEG